MLEFAATLDVRSLRDGGIAAEVAIKDPDRLIVLSEQMGLSDEDEIYFGGTVVSREADDIIVKSLVLRVDDLEEFFILMGILVRKRVLERIANGLIAAEQEVHTAQPIKLSWTAVDAILRTLYLNHIATR